MKIETPWGTSQSESIRAEGIVFHSTSSHGGFHLNAERRLEFQKRLPEFRCFGGYTRWFEEDCDSCAVVIAFAECFLTSEIYDAIRQVRSMARDYVNWQRVVEYIESQPNLLRIETEERTRREPLWETGGMTGGMLKPEFAHHWCVNLRRGSERKTMLFPQYPHKCLFTDAELSSLVEYVPELHDRPHRTDLISAGF